MSGAITEREIKGADVEAVMKEKLLPVLAGMDMGLACSAIFGFALIQQYPDITSDELDEGIKGLSGYAVTFLDSLDDRREKAAGGAGKAAN